MKVICPEHNGLIQVPGISKRNEKNISIKNLVVECPVCLDEIIINGVFDVDHEGNSVQALPEPLPA